VLTIVTILAIHLRRPQLPGKDKIVTLQLSGIHEAALDDYYIEMVHDEPIDGTLPFRHGLIVRPREHTADNLCVHPACTMFS
jgi:hypothetical protein